MEISAGIDTEGEMDDTDEPDEHEHNLIVCCVIAVKVKWMI